MWLYVKNAIFVCLAPGTFAVLVPLLIAWPDTAAMGAPLVVAAALFAAGAALALWCVADFAVFGRGTPAPMDAPKKLVTRGPYRCVRNPMYVGVLAVLAGWAVLFQSWPLAAYALIVATCFHLFVIFYEEPHLRKIFGADFDGYCARVGRWLPRFKGRT